MKRGKDEEEEDKTRGAMFPRVHVNDTEKGGPRAPPRNKMALFQQLSIPSQTTFNAARVTNSPFQQSPSTHHIRKPETRQFEHKWGRQEEEDHDFTVPFFDQQSGTSQHHQTREDKHNAKQNNNKFQKQNHQDFAANQPPRQNSFKETNVRDLQAADNTLWGDSLLSKASGYEDNSVPLTEVQKESLRDGDAVSENSMLDSISGVDISPDDVVGIIGQKHFWKARRAIVNQQRVFAIQVFELHRLIKVQRLIAGSPHLLVEENTYITKPPTVSPIKKIPVEYIMKSTIDTPKLINELKKPNDDMEFSAENAVGKVSLSSVQNGSQTTNCRPFGGHLLPSDQNMGSWNFDPPPGPGPQWLIPVMSPSEGLVYKPYPAPGFMNPVYGGCGPLGSMLGPGYNMSSYGASPSPHHHHHYYEGSLGVNPFTPLPASHGYFPSYGMQVANTLVSSSTTVEPIKPFNQGSTNFQTEKNGHMVKNNIASEDTEVQASTTSSRSDKTKDENALPTSSPAPEPRVVPRVIRVVPHNAQSATASVARIFQSIQEERKKHDSG